MAAYAALVSLFNNLEQIKNHPRLFTYFDKYPIESLGTNIDFLLEYVESYNYDGSISINEAEELESQIAAAAHEAEDIIESQIVDQILCQSTELTSDRCMLDLQKVMLDLNSIKNKVLKVKEANKFNYQKPSASSIPFSTGKSSMVGFDDEVRQLKDVLIGQESSRQIVSIVGMGGTGKTRLAKFVYEHSLIMHHFDVHSWATISQVYNVRDTLSQILSISFKEKFTEETVYELGERLYKSLSGRRYLIILDDMWSIGIWDNIKFFFPENNNGSRIVLTTRLSNVATQLQSICVRINFLDEHESWILFCQEVFGEEDWGEEDCPVELEEIGMKIVEKCKGLPLSIVVIAGLLRKSSRTEKYWCNVAEDINLIFRSSENEQCLDALYLSYSHLPAHLKPCFLYMGTYPEDSNIDVSEIVELWVAEGFLKPNGVQMLEEIAEDYLKDLVDRNLIFVCAHHSNGKIRSCRIHDLLRELCLRVANKENFFGVGRLPSIPQGIDRERRLIFQASLSNQVSVDLPLARSLISNRVEVLGKCRLLRVLNKVFHCSLEAQFQNINLRYFAYLPQPHCAYGWLKLPSSVYLVWNLQTLIIGVGNQVIIAPMEIWNMPQLRHIKCSRIMLPDPPPSDEDDDDFVVLRNLQTLRVVTNFWLSEEVCKRIPNIKKLRIAVDDLWEGYDNSLFDNLQNLGSLHKLESLVMWCSWTTLVSINALKNAFPCSLNKLSLSGCTVHWNDLSLIIGPLPHLEVLKLDDLFSEACKWSCVEGGFLRLKFLQIQSCALESWTLESYSCFPALKKLVLYDLWNLNEIPPDIGEIPTIQLIYLGYCTNAAAISAMKIQKEVQESFGNDDLQIQVVMRLDMVVWFSERVEKEGLSIYSRGRNFVVQIRAF